MHCSPRPELKVAKSQLRTNNFTGPFLIQVRKVGDVDTKIMLNFRFLESCTKVSSIQHLIRRNAWPFKVEVCQSTFLCSPSRLATLMIMSWPCCTSSHLLAMWARSSKDKEIWENTQSPSERAIRAKNALCMMRQCQTACVGDCRDAKAREASVS